MWQWYWAVPQRTNGLPPHLLCLIMDLLIFPFASLQMPELGTVPVTNGIQGEVQAECTATAEVLIPKGKESAIKSEVELSEGVQAPVEQGQLLGKVKYELDGEVIAEYDITAKNSVKELDFGASFMILLRSLFHW